MQSFLTSITVKPALMNYHMEMPDEKLIQFYLSNNPAALATLTDLYKDRIYCVVYATVKDKYNAEIIFREVFLRIINHMMAGKNPENTTFLQWATEVAQRLCLEHNYKVQQPADSNNHCLHMEQQPELPDFSNSHTYYDMHNELRRVIYMLPDGQREVIILHHYAGVSFREIAAKMQCSVTTALDMMKHGLLNLRKLMTEQQLIAA